MGSRQQTPREELSDALIEVGKLYATAAEQARQGRSMRDLAAIQREITSIAASLLSETERQP